MSAPDTSREAVEWLANALEAEAAHMNRQVNIDAMNIIAATLRALLAERDAAKALADQWCDQAQKMAAERDAARAEVARLRQVVRKKQDHQVALMSEVFACHEALGLNSMGFLLTDTAADAALAEPTP
jgi:uncharacterized coiled-coil DUF342 family protein